MDQNDGAWNGDGREANLPQNFVYNLAKKNSKKKGSAYFRDLIDEHWIDIHRFAVAKLGKRMDADDITQQTFYQALLNLPFFKGVNIRGWLFAIARHLIIDHHRDWGRIHFVSMAEESLQREKTALPAVFNRVDAIYDARERIHCCLNCIMTLLPMAEQVAVLLSDIHGFTDKESAARMCMNVPGFKFMLHKARQRMHKVANGNCQLVFKAGLRHACSGYSHDPSKSASTHGNTHRTAALDFATLTQLRQQLINTLCLEEL